MSRWRVAGSLSDRLVQAAVGPTLRGRRVVLRPLRPSDFLAWQEVRRRNGEWLTRWEPRRPPDQPDVAEHRRSFEARCDQRDRDRAMGTSCGLGLFVDDRLAGEVNVNNIVRGAAQYADIHDPIAWRKFTFPGQAGVRAAENIKFQFFGQGGDKAVRGHGFP